MMQNKETNIMLSAATAICLCFVLVILQSILDQKDLEKTDMPAWETEIPEKEQSRPALHGYAKIWTDEEKTSYYQDIDTGYIHRSTASGHIENIPMTDKGGNYLTYDMWISMHPGWHY